MPSFEPPYCPQCGSGDVDLLPGKPAQCVRCGSHWAVSAENDSPPVHHVHDTDETRVHDTHT
jgi:hypothetical protein